MSRKRNIILAGFLFFLLIFLFNFLGVNFNNNFKQSFNSNLDDKFKIIDDVFDSISVRVYMPVNDPIKYDKPLMIYVRGSGYAHDFKNEYDSYLTEFVTKLNIIVIAINHRLAPKYPYPIPTNDCYQAVKYIIKNIEEFGADINKLIIAGDSSGGNAVAVVTQRLLKEKLPLPKLQILIYPWVQMFSFRLPSYLNYRMKMEVLTLYYLGIEQQSDDLKKSLLENLHTSLIEDKKIKQNLKTYLDPNQIPEEFKIGNSYYENYQETIDSESNVMKNISIFSDIKEKLKLLHDPNISPLFNDYKNLIGLPKAYFIIAEKDALKDEGILYAQRLKNLNIEVKIAFYESAYHGIITSGNNLSKEIILDLMYYIQENI